MSKKIVKSLEGTWLKYDEKNFKEFNEANPGWAVDTMDIKCIYELNDVSFRSIGYINNSKHIDLTFPYLGDSEHAMENMVSL